jgi:hypothetical protein
MLESKSGLLRAMAGADDDDDDEDDGGDRDAEGRADPPSEAPDADAEAASNAGRRTNAAK